MKSVIFLGFMATTLALHAQSQKDRGGGVVPYAEGRSSVTLSWRHDQSLITIEGKSAELLYKALQVRERTDNDPFARAGGGLVKEKDNVKCLSSRSNPKTYQCLIRIKN